MHSTNGKLKTGLIIVAAVVAIGGTIFGSTYLGNRLLNQKATGTSQTCASDHPVNHKVVIQNDVVTPKNTVASLCDTLTITDLDNKERLMAFGVHSGHVPYDGVEEKALSKGQSLTITLVQAGNFLFHDHEQDEVRGTFTVHAKQD
jgi:hypothetical protein